VPASVRRPGLVNLASSRTFNREHRLLSDHLQALGSRRSSAVATGCRSRHLIEGRRPQWWRSASGWEFELALPGPARGFASVMALGSAF